jgi:hypothetical protein
MQLLIRGSFSGRSFQNKNVHKLAFPLMRLQECTTRWWRCSRLPCAHGSTGQHATSTAASMEGRATLRLQSVALPMAPHVSSLAQPWKGCGFGADENGVVWNKQSPGGMCNGRAGPWSKLQAQEPPMSLLHTKWLLMRTAIMTDSLSWALSPQWQHCPIKLHSGQWPWAALKMAAGAAARLCQRG